MAGARASNSEQFVPLISKDGEQDTSVMEERRDVGNHWHSVLPLVFLVLAGHGLTRTCPLEGELS